MATMDSAVGKLTDAAQRSVLRFVQGVLQVHNRSREIVDKMDAIDVAYARYKALETAGASGQDLRRADASCGNVFADDDVTPPIVVSQVDAYTGYLADVFLSGSPLFPVVSNPSNKAYAEQMETLLDDHASLGGYVRQLLLSIRDGVKYNYHAVELDWDSINQFSAGADFTSGTGRKINKDAKFFTRIKRLNMRNVIRDQLVLPGDISEKGDYAGYVEIISKMALKQELNKLSAAGEAYNIDKALASGGVVSENPGGNYREDPAISNYVGNSSYMRNGAVNWDAYFEPEASSKTGRASYGARYERIVLYARIMPADLGIKAPQPNTPQIWKFIVINGSHLVCAKRIISAYDYLPILFGQPLEDGMGYQTQSVGESEIPFQSAAATLYNIRFAAARRAVSDRALYSPAHINPNDVNAKGAASKIPVQISTLGNLKISDVYHSIPFDTRGLDNVIQDASTIVGFSKELHGLNSPRQGQFQKGNKSVTEWNDTMAGSDNRLRLPAMTMECQFFGPMKSILALNIFQYGDNAVVVSQRTGERVTIDIAVLRRQVLAFRIADGFTPKSKLASSGTIESGLQLIATSPILQQAYGNRLPAMFAHLMQLNGVRGLEEYDPAYQAPTAPAGLQAAGLQAAPQMPAQQMPQGQPMDPAMQAMPPTAPPAIP